jgi:hypothetical protein
MLRLHIDGVHKKIMGSVGAGVDVSSFGAVTLLQNRNDAML